MVLQTYTRECPAHPSDLMRAAVRVRTDAAPLPLTRYTFLFNSQMLRVKQPDLIGSSLFILYILTVEFYYYFEYFLFFLYEYKDEI
jgi:hypothetical protein